MVVGKEINYATTSENCVGCLSIVMEYGGPYQKSLYTALAESWWQNPVAVKSLGAAH